MLPVSLTPPPMINTGAAVDAPLVLIAASPSDPRAAVLGPRPTITDARHALMAQMVSPAIFNSPVKRVVDEVTIPWSEPQIYDVEGDNDGEYFVETSAVVDLPVVNAELQGVETVEDLEERSRIQETHRASVVEKIGRLTNNYPSSTSQEGIPRGSFAIVGRAPNRFQRTLPNLETRIRGLGNAAEVQRNFSFSEIGLSDLSAQRRLAKSSKSAKTAVDPNECTFLGSCQCLECR
jgi:hypothetical protein